MELDQLRSIKDSFVKELQQAAAGAKTSLPFIRHSLGSTRFVAPGEIFQVLVIGGSFYQKSRLRETNGNLRILTQSQGAQPIFATADDLLQFILSHLDTQTQTLAINFAYPLIPETRLDRLDGVLQSGSKENSFEGLVGSRIGETIEQYIKMKTGRGVKVAIANDTICLLLSGLVTQTWEQLAAGIVGTGLNHAIFLDEKTVINLESGSFDRFAQSEAGHDVDIHSVSPGEAKYEKEVAGAYLYKIFNYLIQKRGIEMDLISTSKQLDYLISAPTAEIADLAKQVLHHSATYTAALTAGILQYCGRDLTFVMQGSLYWKGYQYKETVEKLVAELVPEYKASYINILHSDLFGAAKLVA